MGRDKREWRKLVKKLRRSRIRKAKAQAAVELTTVTAASSSDEEINSTEEVEQRRLHDLEEEAWLERERRFDLAIQAKKIKEEQLAAEQAKIRAEWEEKQRVEAEKRKEAERIEKEKQAKQVMSFKICLSDARIPWKSLDTITKICVDQFLGERVQPASGIPDIETPPLPYLMPESTGDTEEPCLYFSRVGACRFLDRCKRPHPSPTLSSTILIANFFTDIALEHPEDSSLEFEDSDLYKAFLLFYDDVLPEFKKSGTVIQFKVCCNFEPHLRGNVYIQYKTILEAVEAYRKFNGRYYNGRQLTLRFLKLEAWRAAICGQFNRGLCLKGRSCNYLHVFRNPTREFLAADKDWEDPKSFRTPNPSRLRDISSTSRHTHRHHSSPSSSRSTSHSRSHSKRGDPFSRPAKDLKNRHRSRSGSRSRGHDRRRSRSRSHTKRSKKRKRLEGDDVAKVRHKKSKKKSKKHKKEKVNS